LDMCDINPLISLVFNFSIKSPFNNAGNTMHVYDYDSSIEEKSRMQKKSM
jgi:hypothetical protein